MRIVAVFATAVLAFAVSLYFFFPGYIALPVPYHPDMYLAADYAAQNLSPAGILLAPRPLFFETLFFAGHLGLEGSLLFFDAILLLDLALAVVLLERAVLRRRLPWAIVFGTLLLAMAGPGFYRQPGSEINLHLALLFALLGACVWELRSPKRQIAALVVSGALFIGSVLANEGTIPALTVYCIAAAFRSRRSPYIAAILACLPAAAVAVVLWDSRLSHSPFVVLNAQRAYPYKIDLSLASIAACARFYMQPLANAGFLILFGAIGFGLWLQRRLLLGVALGLTALSFYAPFLVLPNHLDPIYQWVSMPLLVLLVPLAWADPRNARSAGTRLVPAARAALVAALAFAIAFTSTQWRDQKRWTEIAMAQNRTVLDALASLKRPIRASRNILISGLGFGRWPFMHSASYMSKRFDFHGGWSVTNEPGFPAIDNQSVARPIDYRAIRWNDYDFVLLFNRDGDLAGALDRREVAVEIARRGLEGLPTRAVVDMLTMHYPPGIAAPRGEADAQRRGVYLETAPAACCFLGADAAFELRKPAGDSTIVFSFLVPATAPFAHAPEIVNVLFEGVPAGSAPLSPGVHDVRFRLSPAMAKRTRITSSMHMSISYVPKQIGMNGDTRRLSIKLLRVSYRP